ncbi:MAG: hypothetical protein ACK4NY_08285 [Spirosomataceae bacterium]
MEEMNSFFDFLQKHIENGGYNEMLKMYTGDNLTKVSYNNDGEIIGEEDFYLDPNAPAILSQFTSEDVIINKEILNLRDISYINPTNFSIRVETYDFQNTLIDVSVKYFYDELVELYKSKLGLLKNSFANALMKYVTDVNSDNINKGILIKLNHFLELSDSQDYIVTAQDGTSKNLLQKFLQDSVNWILKQSGGEIPQQKPNQDITEIDFNGAVNKFNGMHIAMVKEHFETLLSNSKNGEPYLSSEKFDAFIKTVFIEGKNLETNKIEMNLGRGENKIIINIFYQFYSNSVKSIQIEANTQTKDKYVKLLTDNFSNFEYKKVHGNFR